MAFGDKLFVTTTDSKSSEVLVLQPLKNKRKETRESLSVVLTYKYIYPRALTDPLSVVDQVS